MILNNINTDFDWENFLSKLNSKYQEQEEAYKNREYLKARKKLYELLPDYFKIFTTINTVYRQASILPDYKNNQYDIGIFLVGFSYVPVILSILEIKPKKVIFVPSKDTDFLINVIVEAVNVVDPDYTIKERFQKIIINDFSDPSKVFQEIDTLIKDHSNEYIAIDITGGKKTMIAGAFMASASSKSCDIYYVDFEEYDEIKGLPIPCTEFLAKLPNPVEIFSLADWERIESLFDNYQFRQVCEELDKIKDNINKNKYYFKLGNDIPILNKIEIIEKYSKAYECWNDFRYNEAFQYLPDNPALKILKKIFDNNLKNNFKEETDARLTGKCLRPNSKKIDAYTFLEKIDKRNQIAYKANLSKLNKTIGDEKEKEIYDDEELYSTYIFDRYMNAERKKQQGQYQVAFLLFISLAEFLITLWADINYPPGTLDELREKNPSTGELYGIKFSPFLKLCQTDKNKCPFLSSEDVISLRSYYMQRNKLVLIHSTNTIKEDKAIKAGELVYNIIKKHLNKKSPDLNLEDLMNSLRFKRFREIFQ